MASNYEPETANLDSIGWGAYHHRSFLVCGLSWCNMLLWQACISISLQETKSQWHLSNIQLGLIGSAHNIGILLGCYFWGYIGNTKGRLIGLKFVFALNAVFGLLYTCAVNFPMLCTSSALVGLCGGGAKVLTGALYLETLPKDKKWTLVLLTGFISLGGVLGYLFAVVVVAGGTYEINVWRWVGGCDFVVMVGVLGLLFSIFESPKFLISQQREDQAASVLMYGVCRKIAKINKRKVEVDLETQSKIMSVNDEHMLTSTKSGSLKEIFVRKYLKQTILITLVTTTQCMFLSDLSYSGLIAFMPILLARANYSISSKLVIYSTILAQISIGIPGVAISSFFVKAGYKKKWIIVLGFVFCGLSTLFFLVAWEYWMVFLAVCFNNFFNQMGYSCLVGLINESYKVRVRSLAVGWASAWSNFGGAISPVTLGVIFEAQGDILLGVFILSVAFCVVGVVAVFLHEPQSVKMLGTDDQRD